MKILHVKRKITKFFYLEKCSATTFRPMNLKYVLYDIAGGQFDLDLDISYQDVEDFVYN